MRRLLCIIGRHKWQMFGRRHLIGNHWTRYDLCPVCHEMRVRGEELTPHQEQYRSFAPSGASLRFPPGIMSSQDIADAIGRLQSKQGEGKR